MANKVTDYKRAFNEQNYDRLYITIPKGRKEVIQAAADAQEQSLNGYVVEAVERRMESEKT